MPAVAAKRAPEVITARRSSSRRETKSSASQWYGNSARQRPNLRRLLKSSCSVVGGRPFSIIVPMPPLVAGSPLLRPHVLHERGHHPVKLIGPGAASPEVERGKPSSV